MSELVLAEPDRHMRARLEARAGGAKPRVEVIDAPAEALPFSDGHFDAAVSTLVLCSVQDPDRAAGELRRVIRPGGRLVVIGHVGAEPGGRRAAHCPSWLPLAAATQAVLSQLRALHEVPTHWNAVERAGSAPRTRAMNCA